MNEACQADVADIRRMDGVDCFVITEMSESEQTDKRLKTASSERIVPVHASLIDLGLMGFVRQRKRAGETKLFAEVGMGATGYRSTTFSAWFRRFLAKAGAASPKTCFHSFRHGFRDALREAHIDRDIALALGSWTAGNGSTAVSDAYGNGYRVATLKDAIDRERYLSLDLSHLHE